LLKGSLQQEEVSQVNSIFHKGTVCVISSDPPYEKEVVARFTTVPFNLSIEDRALRVFIYKTVFKLRESCSVR